MRVLYDHQIFTIQKFGGVNRYFNQLMLAEKKEVQIKKINPDLFNPIPPGRKDDLFSRGLRFLKKATTRVKNEQSSLPDEATRIFTDNNFDIFHPTYFDPYFLNLTNKPFVLTVYDMIHEIYKEYFPWNDRTSHGKRLLCQKASQVIAISNKTKEDVLEI